MPNPRSCFTVVLWNVTDLVTDCSRRCVFCVPSLILARVVFLCFIFSSIHSMHDLWVSGAQNDIYGDQSKVVLRRYAASTTSPLDAMERCSSSFPKNFRAFSLFRFVPYNLQKWKDRKRSEAKRRTGCIEAKFCNRIVVGMRVFIGQRRCEKGKETKMRKM